MFVVFFLAAGSSGSATAKVMQKPRSGIAVRLKIVFRTAQSMSGIQAKSAEGDTPYCFLNAVEKCDGFLNPTSA